MTMSYREDADISIPHGKFHVTKVWLKDQVNATIQNFAVKNRHIAQKYLSSDTGAFVAQFNSQCISHSGRGQLVKSLMQHVKVDVFGSCGNNTCDKDQDCYQMMNQTYKFYLSLENSVCQDYVTEKFFNILPYNVIPVVLNGANMDHAAPPHSYINVQDFQSTKELAEYLHQVNNNDTLFASYFWWRNFYTVKVKLLF